MAQQLRMTEHQYGGVMQTHVWQGRGLYIFRGTMDGAKHWAALLVESLVQDSDVTDVPLRGFSLVWVENIPYLFPGTLTAALGRGKGYLRGRKHREREALAREKRALVQFNAEYAGGIDMGG